MRPIAMLHGVHSARSVPPGQSNLPARRFRAESSEAAALQVRTADGDTVTISFAAASSSSAAGVDVRVAVNGSLDDAEVGQIGDLLDKLVQSARNGDAPKPLLSSGFGELDGYQFAYRAYKQSSEAALLY